jgi:arginine deiminase
MEQFGVYSEVGKLRKVIVHRPELSLKRLTPTNHDDLLFDDVLWVERAQWEHDQFVAAMRARGTQVFHLDTPSAGRWSTRCARACGTCSPTCWRSISSAA